MTDQATYAGQPTIKSRILEFLRQRPGEGFTNRQIAEAIGLTAERTSASISSMVSSASTPVAKKSTTPEGIGLYMYQEARIEPAPGGGMRLAIPGDDEDDREEEAGPGEEGEEGEEKPIGNILSLCGRPLPSGDIIISDDQQNLWRASRLT